MYTNIDTDHLIDVLEKFLELVKDELPDKYPTKLVIEAVSLVMRNNIFEFGDCTFKQLIGSAVGTPVTVQTATIYYAYHEITVLIPYPSTVVTSNIMEDSSMMQLAPGMT